ncbi:MAG: carboxypeptidase regulatory-like domain-containing protein [Chitinophagales bacterium]|jgi:hypothetical protein|nr:carboxypeptidase regulatory-like domain-containing protein [Chitinophagales bacterium]HNI43156.1 carboxypeptidase-like regulatory domain-containing protein [Chitinophagales bacterium]
MERSWIFQINTFYVNTGRSMKLALTLFEDTYAKLSAEADNDTDIAVILSNFKPAYISFRELYAQKQAFLGIYEGETLNFETVMAEIPQHLRRWEGLVRAIFVEDTPQERAIFPNKRTPFLSGTYEQRVSAVESLVVTLSRYSALSNVHHLVETYYNQLMGARMAQQKQEGQSEKLSSLLYKQHQITCQELYGVLGALMNKYRYEPERISDFIDISLIRSKNATGGASIFKGSVKNMQDEPIAEAIVRLVDSGYETITDQAGNFEIEVESGNFDVLVAAIGYKSYEQKNIIFAKDKPTEMTFTLLPA